MTVGGLRESRSSFSRLKYSGSRLNFGPMYGNVDEVDSSLSEPTPPEYSASSYTSSLTVIRYAGW